MTMKKLILSLITVAAVSLSYAQTVFFFEDFQDVTDIDMIANLDDLEPEQWANWDVDELLDNNGELSNWFWALGPEHTFIDGTTTAFVPLDGVEDTPVTGLDFSTWMIEGDGVEDSNFVFSSTSWLEGYADGNRNWLVIPEVTVTEAATLTFRAGSAQGPRYSDGFSVWIATDGFDDPDNYVEIFRVAQCIPPVPSSATVGTDALDLNAGTVFHGPDGAYIPYEGFDPVWENLYFHLGGQDYNDASSYRGLLEPFSIDLAAYAGETIRIAFLHDSDDDVSIDLDDIKIESTVINIEEIAQDYYSIFPNPVEDQLNIQMTDKLVGHGDYRIIDSKGSLISRGLIVANGASITEQVDVSNLAAGSYTFQLLTNDTPALNTTFIKK